LEMIEEAMTEGMVLARAEGILEGVTDGTLLVLKGHLLIEEALYRMVCTKLLQPQFLNKANLRFSQLLHIARALYPDDEVPAAVWETVEALNTLRNRLAHHLEPSDLRSLLLKFTGPKPPPKVVSLDDPIIIDRLGGVIAVLVGFYFGAGLRPRPARPPS
jgi:hypothetical protein